MNINRDNYELILVDYADGTLTAEMRQQVEKFLLLNPDIQIEFELFDNIHIENTNEEFSEKEILKNIPLRKTYSSSEYFQQLCIAYIEGKLNDNEQVFFDEIIKGDSKKQKELSLFEKTKLVPDFSIIYPDKRKIKHFTLLSTGIKKHASFVASVAAILILAFMIFYTTTIDDKTQLAGIISVKNNIKDIEKPIIADKNDAPALDDEKEQKKSIFDDPFGFEKISGKKQPIAANNTLKKMKLVKLIQPIGVKQLNCKLCKKIFNERTMLKGFANKTTNELLSENSKKQKREPFNKERIWQLAQAGISELNKVTNAEFKVVELEKQNKTKIAFNSRLFSFSTNVKNKK